MAGAAVLTAGPVGAKNLSGKPGQDLAGHRQAAAAHRHLRDRAHGPGDRREQAPGAQHAAGVHAHGPGRTGRLPAKKLDDTDAANCLPPGMPGVMTQPYPIQILVTPGEVTIIQEAYMQVRHVHTDGRDHAADPDLTFNGDSIGHWEGDTLVVDTTGLAPQAVLQAGVTHSKNEHIVERYRLSDPTCWRSRPPSRIPASWPSRGNPTRAICAIRVQSRGIHLRAEQPQFIRERQGRPQPRVQEGAMNKILISAASALSLAAAASAPALAHHSFAMFDFQASKTVTGTVEQFDWTNPHTFIWLQVPDRRGQRRHGALRLRRHEPELPGPPRLEQDHAQPRRQGDRDLPSPEGRLQGRHLPEGDAVQRQGTGEHRLEALSPRVTSRG
ncbi:MAG: DUF6152 family protein [Caulobacteraceae bacterium]